jgi:hypothetical protein
MLFLVPSSSSPLLARIEPSLAEQGSSDLTLVADGAGFGADATLWFADTPLATRVVDPTRLNADLPADRLATDGAAAVRVTQQGGTMASNRLSFWILAVR